jgi:hypothetical protein
VRLALRLVLVAAFLLAQAAGIAHQAWHDAGGFAAQAGTGAPEGKAPPKNPLCDFHSALASVLGAIQGAPAASVAIASPPPFFLAAEVSAARFSSFAPQSRAPPTLL